MLSEEDNELLELIQSIGSSDLVSKRDSSGIPYLKSIFYLYQKLFGETCTTCSSKIAGYIQKLKNYNFKNPIIMQESNYILQEGTLIVIPGTSLAYSNANLTDEVALKFLSENLNRKSLFVKIPEDIDQDIQELIDNGGLLNDAPVDAPIEETVAENVPAKASNQTEKKHGRGQR